MMNRLWFISEQITKNHKFLQPQLTYSNPLFLQQSIQNAKIFSLLFALWLWPGQRLHWLHWLHCSRQGHDRHEAADELEGVRHQQRVKMMCSAGISSYLTVVRFEDIFSNIEWFWRFCRDLFSLCLMTSQRGNWGCFCQDKNSIDLCTVLLLC